MSDFLTESESLRACNLPSTTNWREWLRKTLPAKEISTGKIYDRAAVETLAAAVRPINADITLPPEDEREATEPPRMGFSGPVDAGTPRTKRAQQLTNRIIPNLETR